MCLTCTSKRAVWAKSEVNLAESGTGKVVLKIGVDQPMGGGSDPGKLAERVCGFTCVGAFARKRVSFHRVKRVSRQVWRRNCFPHQRISVCLLSTCLRDCLHESTFDWMIKTYCKPQCTGKSTQTQRKVCSSEKLFCLPPAPCLLAFRAMFQCFNVLVFFACSLSI